MTKQPQEINIPDEYKNPLDRSLDPRDVDARMSAQAPFEGVTPKPFDLGDGQADSTKPNRPERRITRRAKAGAYVVGAVLAIPAGDKAIDIVGNAGDHELDSGKPTLPQPSEQGSKTIRDGNGNLIRVYPHTPPHPER